jgi:phosphoribosylformimino-5-aminoimidazole carboxamide ribonucleotide (ProFAR) isomerase
MKNTQTKMKQTDETLIIFAMRYAIGRRTAAPSMVADKIIEVWPQLQEWTQKQMQREISVEIDRGNGGDRCDVETWKKVLNLEVEELSKQIEGKE